MNTTPPPAHMPHFIRRFESDLEQFRKIAHLDRSEVCATMNICHKRYTQLMQVIRRETGRMTRNEQAKANFEKARQWLGDRDPSAITCQQFAEATGTTKGQAARYRQTLIRERARFEQPKEPPKLKVFIGNREAEREANRMFWVVGDKLFSKNRQPAEVGLNS